MSIPKYIIVGLLAHNTGFRKAKKNSCKIFISMWTDDNAMRLLFINKCKY